jgi:hypothetical protein
MKKKEADEGAGDILREKRRSDRKKVVIAIAVQVGGRAHQLLPSGRMRRYHA